MKNAKILILLLIFFIIYVYASKVNVIKRNEIENKKIPFGVGEKFVYAIKFLGITAGIGEIEIKEIVTINGRKAYHIIATAKAVPPFSWFHRVDDKVESFIDIENMYSHKLIKSLREGRYEKDVTLEFDQVNHKVRYIGENKEFEVPENVQDFLSAFYYFRTVKIDVGIDPIVKVHADEKNWDFQVKILGKEIIKTILGRKECFIIKPIMNFESVFKQRGDVTLWVTADQYLIPVYMKTDAMIGLVYAKLIEITYIEK